MTMNTRKTIIAALVAALSAAPLTVAPLQAQAQTQAQAQRMYSQAELDQMLAPIALYPDALLSQILMAATYPIEVVEAARWTRSNPGLKGDAAVRAVQNEDWDPSVKSLVAFPQILQRMDEQLEWTRSLGDAFLAQEPQLMAEVQELRRRAHAAGNLRSDGQIHVEQQGQTIVVQPASPQVVYVPYYDPLVVYGPWWWPAYQPVVWAPWPGYVRPYHSAVSVGFWWGAPVSLSVGFFFGNFDWHQRHVRVVHPRAYYYRPPVVVVNRTVNRTVVADRGRWQHDPHHRRQVAYRAPEVRQRFASAQVDRRDAQREERRDARGLERRDVQREERREERPAARVQAQPPASRQVQPQTQAPAKNVERRIEQRETRQTPSRPEQRDTRQAPPSRPEQREARQAPSRPQALPPQRAPASVAQPQPQQRMPAAVAPQTPRAERQEQRQERRGQREEHRQERGQKG